MLTNFGLCVIVYVSLGADVVDHAVQDQNLGLIEQAIGKAPHWLIKKLTLTYLTLSLEDIASQIGADGEEPVRSMLVRMVCSSLVPESARRNALIRY